MSNPLSTTVLLSVQRALLGEITTAMRAIAVKWTTEVIELRVYVEGEVTEDTVGEFDSGVVTQIVADFSFPERGDPLVKYQLLRCDDPVPIPFWGHFVFTRSGVLFAQEDSA